jgi:hypothetical protein
MPKRSGARKVTDAENRIRQGRLENGERYTDPSVADALSGEVSVHEECQGTRDWLVEYFDDDGGCYVTIFSGPAAEHRARGYFAALKTGSIDTLRVDRGGDCLAERSAR